MWWRGPTFLKKVNLQFNTNGVLLEDETFSQELKTTCLFIHQVETRKRECLEIDSNRFSSFVKLKRTIGWIYRFLNNLKDKQQNRNGEILLVDYLTASELEKAEQKLILMNQNTFDKEKLKTISRDFNLIVDDENLIRCEGRLKHAPIPYDAKTPFLINPENYIAELLIKHIHELNKHISIKQTLTEIRQKFWIIHARKSVRKILRKCVICRKLEGQPFRYPVAPSLTKLRLSENFSFYTTGIDNFGPMYVKNIFGRNYQNLYKRCGTLYTCAASRAIVLDLVPNLDSQSFIRSFRRFISRRGCPCNVITDNGSNFMLTHTQSYVNNLGVHWHANLPLAPWHGGFFERLVRSVKELLRKVVANARLTFEELQMLLSEVEAIVNNRPLTYVYEDNVETCLTPNLMLFGRALSLTNSESVGVSQELFTIDHTQKLSNLTNHFWERWKRKYLVGLRESHRMKRERFNKSEIQLKDVVIVHEEKIPRLCWKLGIVEKLIQSSDGEIRGAEVRIPKTKTSIARPVNKLYLVEHYVDKEKKEDNENVNSRPRREAAALGELRRKYANI